MSITDFINKIKHFKDIDNFTHLYFFIVVFVGISSFGLGRLSVEIKSYSILNQPKNQEKNIPSLEEKKFLASKNGKLYYTIGCSGAKRIAEKNIIWFGTSAEAELAGYKPSLSCNK